MKKLFEGWWFLVSGGGLIAFGLDLVSSKGLIWLLGILSIVVGVFIIAIFASLWAEDLE